MGSYPPGKKTGFYRPHALAQRMMTNFDNLVLDEKTGELEPMPSMTRQSEMEACDLHNILKQFTQQGLDQQVLENAKRGQYADLPDEIDYQASLNLVMAAEASFATLPAQVRERFQNDPGKFLGFVSDPANVEELVRLGIAEDKTPREPPPQKVEIVNPTPQQGGAGGTPPAGGAKAP